MGAHLGIAGDGGCAMRRGRPPLPCAIVAMLVLAACTTAPPGGDGASPAAAPAAESDPVLGSWRGELDPRFAGAFKKEDLEVYRFLPRRELRVVVPAPVFRIRYGEWRRDDLGRLYIKLDDKVAERRVREEGAALRISLPPDLSVFASSIVVRKLSGEQAQVVDAIEARGGGG